jgi:hypothetical protein
MIDKQYNEFFRVLRGYLGNSLAHMEQLFDRSEISEHAAVASYLLFFNSFHPDSPDFEAAIRVFSQILHSESSQLKRVLIRTLSFIHHSSVPAFVKLTWSCVANDFSIYADVTAALMVALENSQTFVALTQVMLNEFINFLGLLQDYFIELRINGPRAPEWTSLAFTTIEEHMELCVNYCVIIATLFNNSEQLNTENEEVDVASKRVIAEFLVHWAQLPSPYTRLAAFALNALVALITAGNAFPDASNIDQPILDMMLKCQLDGYRVFDTLLLFHFDDLIEEFVKQLFLSPRTDSLEYLDAIIATLETENTINRRTLSAHLGTILLAVSFCHAERPDDGRTILLLLAKTFIDDNSEPLIRNAQNFDFVPTLFPFATEQVIQLALTMLIGCRQFIAVRRIVSALTPWFQNVRVVPTNNWIVQGIDPRFHKFDVKSFFTRMFDVSRDLPNDLNEVFGELCSVLLNAADNHNVVLMCLFEGDDPLIKERLFGQLMHHNAPMVSKYLAKRCSFSYWYFMRTQRHAQVSSLNWMLKVLKRVFTHHGGFQEEPALILPLHFALIFIEESSFFFESFVRLYGLPDPHSLWRLDSQTSALKVVETVAVFVQEFEDAPFLLEKWAKEALRWVLGCNDVRTAYRSLVIFNALHSEVLGQCLPVLAHAVAFHITQVIADARRAPDIAAFVGESFCLLENHLDADPEIVAFAFPFASAFLTCPLFQSNCLDRAMPIFMHSVANPFLAVAAKRVLVQAFVPYIAHLEESEDAQQRLLDVAKCVDAPALYFVIAPFLFGSIPFLPIDHPYEEIMAMALSPEQLNLAIFLLTTVAQTASPPLAEAILAVMARVVCDRGKEIHRDALAPLYQFAIPRIAVVSSAVDFVRKVAAIDPSIAVHRESVPAVHKSADDVLREIAKLEKTAAGSVPITNCKSLVELYGLIDQKSPPKIAPFATHYEIYVGISKDWRSTRRTSEASYNCSLNRLGSTTSLRSGIVINRSFVLATAMIEQGMKSVQYRPLAAGPIKEQLLDIPPIDSATWKFVVTPEEFAGLDDDADEDD